MRRRPRAPLLRGAPVLSRSSTDSTRARLEPRPTVPLTLTIIWSKSCRPLVYILRTRRPPLRSGLSSCLTLKVLLVSIQFTLRRRPMRPLPALVDNRRHLQSAAVLTTRQCHHRALMPTCSNCTRNCHPSLPLQAFLRLRRLHAPPVQLPRPVWPTDRRRYRRGRPDRPSLNHQ